MDIPPNERGPRSGGRNGAQFFRVRTQSLRVDSVTDFDLYISMSADREPVLYREKHLLFTREALDRLRDLGVSEFLVHNEQREVYYHYVEANLEAILSDTAASLPEKTQVLYDCAHNVVREFMSNPNAGEVIPRSETLVNNLVKFIFEDDTSFSYFLKASSFDYHTYTHSVNVFVYSVTLAQFLGHDDPAFLHDFGTGALLHDIGKSRVPADVLNCKGALSDAQWGLMKKHPEWGHDILKKQGVTNEIVLRVTRHHHEKLSGGGYPDGLRAAQLPYYVRIATICDIFDALTTRRSYKNALNSFPALKLMQDEFKGQIDPEIFSSFVRMMSTATQPAIS